MDFKPETPNNTTRIDYEYYISCNFGIHNITYSLNNTFAITGDYLIELVIFKV